MIRTDDGAISLLVDEIGDVVEVEAAGFELTPDNVNPSARELMRGVYKLKDRLLLILDTAKTIDLA
jgi:purine-binding chemotaxis protein CheW